MQQFFDKNKIDKIKENIVLEDSMNESPFKNH